MGAFPAGVGLAGADPAFGSDRVDRAPAAGLHVEGSTLDHELDEDGHYRSVHPVDAEVWLNLRTVAGWIKSAPEVGQTISHLTHIDERLLQRQVEDRVRLALANVLRRRAIRIDQIIGATSVRGRIDAAVVYVNLLSKDKRPKRVPLT
jgi:hypothetical protein